MMRPLEGITVVEFGTYVAAPALGNMLGMLGAEVIKVEPPGGDPTRSVTPWSWANYNWNKKSVSLDLKTKAGMEIFRRLLAKSDVLIESVSPRAVRELQINYRAARRLNPRLIYCSIKGFASNSSSANRVGFDSIAQAEGGLMYVVRGEGRRPSRVGNPCVDLGAAAFGAVAILSLLMRKPRRGGFIEIPLYDLVVYWNGYWFPYIDLHRREPADLGTSHPGFSPYGIYSTNDGFVFIGVLSDGQWEKLAEKLGLPSEERFRFVSGRNEARDEIDGVLQSAISSMKSSKVLTLLGADVPCAKVNSLAEIYSNRELRERGVVRRVAHEGEKLSIVLPPFSQSLRPSVRMTNPPELGSDTERVLKGLGYTRNSFVKLREKDVIG
jgi:crotonobetainyl-CoA:carnitine CoA-transferase CaiB-like acyl-CoA transferase